MVALHLLSSGPMPAEISPRGQSTGFNSGESRCNPVAYILALPVSALPQTSETKSTDIRSNPNTRHVNDSVQIQRRCASTAAYTMMGFGPQRQFQSATPADHDRFT
ncbi:hypothetical protein B0H19DRAFT_1242569 [Mycena capillaripes]|nr:hypothetical protein B0H19DRAFT_1242569 [Mycena capillaripes]